MRAALVADPDLRLCARVVDRARFRQMAVRIEQPRLYSEPHAYTHAVLCGAVLLSDRADAPMRVGTERKRCSAEHGRKHCGGCAALRESDLACCERALQMDGEREWTDLAQSGSRGQSPPLRSRKRNNGYLLLSFKP